MYVTCYGSMSYPDGIEELWRLDYASFYQVLITLAAVIIFGPELGITQDPAAPPGQFRSHKLPMPWSWSHPETKQPYDWARGVTNFFSRAYSTSEDDLGKAIPYELAHLQSITDSHRRMSLSAIQDIKSHVLKGLTVVQEIQLSMATIEASFKDAQTFKDWMETERKWANILWEFYCQR